jgi:hypothetical protein
VEGRKAENKTVFFHKTGNSMIMDQTVKKVYSSTQETTFSLPGPWIKLGPQPKHFETFLLF